MILLLKFHRIYRSVLLNWGGGWGAEYKENPGVQFCNIRKRQSGKSGAGDQRAPNDQKQRLKASLCVAPPRPESKRTSNDICHFMVTRPQSFQPAAGAPIKLVDKEGIPGADPAYVVSYLLLDGTLWACEARSEPGSCQPSRRQTDTTGTKPGGCRPSGKALFRSARAACQFHGGWVSI